MMKTYREMIGPLHNNPALREQVEWSNTWYDNARAPQTTRRILFIGDCMLRQVRSRVSQMMDMPIDIFGTSACLNDELFAEQIDSFFKNVDYRYETIVIQQGHHGNMIQGKPLNAEQLATFERNLHVLVDFLGQYSDKVVMVTLLTYIIPWKHTKLNKWLYRHGFKKEQGDPVANPVEFRKNDIIRSLANEMDNATLCDIHSTLAASRYLRIDHVHYEPKSHGLIASTIVNAIKEEGK